ncbi:hypothetical protein [Pedobacter immunditicola]|uniref:phosphotriesterase family protein n=1 Tax=Pedobacter immunditicola TaxID=3133440 RepID=UPI0030A0FDA2
MMDRRIFIRLSSLGVVACAAGHSLTALAGSTADGYLMTVTGRLKLPEKGVFLPHEHVLTDFTGAEKIVQPQYNRTIAFKKMLPNLIAAKKAGVNVLTECTPAYIGRDVILLKMLAEASGIAILTNTGYYAAAGLKYLPRHAYRESSLVLSARWLKEWENGIEGTGIRPGFIKLGVDGGPLKEVEQKLIQAAAYTHLKSGLKIAIHNGNSSAVAAEIAILEKMGIDPKAMIWVHAQNASNSDVHMAMAKKGCWISLDGVSDEPASLEKYLAFIKVLKKESLLHRLLLSHDDGFAVENHGGEVTFKAYKDGNHQPYTSLMRTLKPALLKDVISEEEYELITVKNPVQAFKIEVCRSFSSI